MFRQNRVNQVHDLPIDWKSYKRIQEDIRFFKQKGAVIVMGDFNRRIGKLPSVVREQQIYLHRKSQDKQVKQGRLLMEVMNACDMVVLNGLEEEAQFTFENDQGESLIDYIGLDVDLVNVQPIHDVEEINEEHESGRIIDCQGQILGSESNMSYIPSSLTVWNNPQDVISDHFLLTCKYQRSLRRSLRVCHWAQEISFHRNGEGMIMAI